MAEHMGFTRDEWVAALTPRLGNATDWCVDSLFAGGAPPADLEDETGNPLPATPVYLNAETYALLSLVSPACAEKVQAQLASAPAELRAEFADRLRGLQRRRWWWRLWPFRRPGQRARRSPGGARTDDGANGRFAGFTEEEWVAAFERTLGRDGARVHARRLFESVESLPGGSKGYTMDARTWALFWLVSPDCRSRVEAALSHMPAIYRREVERLARSYERAE